MWCVKTASGRGHLCKLATAAALVTMAGSPAARASETAHGVTFPVDQVRSSLQYCYQHQRDGNGEGTISENFLDRQYNPFDSRGADDFTLMEPCTVRSVNVYGLAIDQPPMSFRVTFYEDRAGLPASQIRGQTHLTYSQDVTSFTIPLRVPVTLSPGTYWVSVKANGHSIPGSTGWYWERATVNGAGSVWRNVKDGYRTGCTSWQRTQDCGRIAFGDFVFALIS